LSIDGSMMILKSLARIAFLSISIVAGLLIGFGMVIRQPTFGRIEFDDGDRADAWRLQQHVEFLSLAAVPRSWRHAEGLNLAASYIETHFGESGARIDEQVYSAGDTRQRNIIGRFGASSGPIVVVGARYDAYGSLPAADDNASGVAGLLELARLLGGRELEGGVELVAYSTEEPPWFGSDEMGSSVHAASLASGGDEVAVMVCLEMIGFFSEEQPDQSALLGVLYPRHGNFVVVAGRWEDRRLARRFKRAFRGGTELEIVSYSGPTVVGTDLSDHRNYWAHGWPAVMVSDTAFLRNPNYHLPSDTAETLDYERAAEAVNGVLNAVMDLLSGN